MVKNFKIAALINTLLYAIFFYLSWNNITDIKLGILFTLSIISLVVTIMGKIKKIGTSFYAVGILPFVITALVFILYITGIWVFIAILFFDVVPFAPN